MSAGVALSFGFSLLLAACNGNGGGSDEGGSGETDGESPHFPPDLDGLTCNQPGHGGWKVRCGFSDWTATYDGQILQHVSGPQIDEPAWLDHSFPGDTECCDGCPSHATVEASCTLSCKAQLCEELRAHHGMVATSGFGCAVPKFNMEGCLTLDVFEQPLKLELDNHLQCKTTRLAFASANCGTLVATDPSQLFNGCFDFAVGAEEFQPPGCNTPADFGPGGSVVGGFTTDTASASGGTFASLTWLAAGESGVSRTEDIEVDLAYAEVACGEKTCFSLSQFEASIPTTTLEGLTLENAHLSLYEAKDVSLGRTGDFVYAPGDVQAVLSADVNGARVWAVGTSSGRATGHVSPSTGVVYLRDLQFEYASEPFEANLILSMEGNYTSRRPLADIALLSSPASCDEPVAFLAASRDYDGDPLTHHWEVTTSGQKGTGELFEVKLAEGEHRIVLRSSDGTSRHGYASFELNRSCRP